MPGDGTKTGITTNEAVLPPQPMWRNAVDAYRMRWKRRRLLWRAFRARHQLRLIKDRINAVPSDRVMVFCVLRNEHERLPHFLDHYRSLGVGGFVFVDNGSYDGSAELLASQPDCSVWVSTASYKSARFGVDWINYLLNKYGSGRCCLTVDADELIAFSGMDRVDLSDLSRWMRRTHTRALGALMIELFPKGPVSMAAFKAGDDPLQGLTHFDAGPYRAQRQRPMRNLWVQGAARERVFFADAPRRSPTLNKIPLVRWRRGYVYVNSTHSMLPPNLNSAYIDASGRVQPSVALLHTKFLPSIVARAAEEKARGEHFSNSSAFDAYYDALQDDPVLWHDDAVAYVDPEQLEALGLIASGGWEV
ncbi:MAG: glycosyltransferase family 2 protein [Pseudomonadota bacterium]